MGRLSPKAFAPFGNRPSDDDGDIAPFVQIGAPAAAVVGRLVVTHALAERQRMAPGPSVEGGAD